MKQKGSYSIKLFCVLMAIFLAIVGLLNQVPLAIYGVGFLFILSLVGDKKEYVFGALLALLALSVMNEVLVEKNFSFYLVSRGAIFLLAGVVSIKSGAMKNAWFLSPFYVLVGYVLYMMLASLQGWAPMISELKAILFLVFLVAFVSLVSAVNVKLMDVQFLRTGILVVAGFYIFGSIAVIPFPAIGESMIMARRGLVASEYVAGGTSLFNGVSWHSQTLGPLMAMLNAFLLSDYLCAVRKKSWLYRALLLGIPVVIYKTSSRTAMLAYVISVVFALFYYYRERGVHISKRQRVVGLFAGFAVMSLLGALLVPSLRLQLESMLRKQGGVETMDRSVSLSESMTATRMELVEEGFNNFKESPLFGNGFQVSSGMERRTLGGSGFVFSAPVEKGVLPIMVLEEGGVVGAFIMIWFVLLLYIKYNRLRLHCFLTCFTTLLALDFGEAVFFSTSGAGGILWAICFAALAIDVGRRSHELAMQRNASMLHGFNMPAGGY